MTIPDTTTHVWTPAIEHPVVGWIMRRAYFRNLGEGWQSYSVVEQCWFNTNNDAEWFDEEAKNGYLVTLDEFQEPEFVFVKE